MPAFHPIGESEAVFLSFCLCGILRSLCVYLENCLFTV